MSHLPSAAYIFGGPVPPYAAVAVGAALAVGVILTNVFLGRGEAPWRRAARAALRLAALAGVVVVMLAPSVSVRVPSSRRPAVAVLVDDSASLAVVDGAGGASRLEEARSALDALRRGASGLGERCSPEWYRFSDGLYALAEGSPQGSGTQTALGSALEELAGRERPSRLACAVIISDGASNAGADPGAAAAGLARASVPVHTIRLGGAAPVVDAAVISLEAPATARVRDSVPVACTVRVLGCRGRPFSVGLQAEGQEMESRRLVAGTDDETHELEFRYVLGAAGTHRLRAAVKLGGRGPADELAANDSRTTFITSVEGPLKVMLVAGALGWDYGALRSSLGSSPEVHLETVRAFLRRSDELAAAAGRFDEFHVVILSGISGAELPRARWQRLADTVRGGAGLLVLLGERSTPLAGLPPGEVLPVVVEPDSKVAACEGGPVLTSAGERHTATAVTENPAARRGAWQSLAPLPARVPIESVRPGGVVLVTDGGGAPLVAAGEAGRGRAVAVLSSESHVWRRTAEEEDDTYAAFVRAAVRYLAGLDAASGRRARLRLERHSLRPGERLGIRAELAPAEEPAGGAPREMSVKVEGPGADLRVRLSSLGPESGGRSYWGEVALDEPGEYELELRLASQAADRSSVIVESLEWEMRDPRPRHDLLRGMSSGSGGISVEAAAAKDILAELDSALPAADEGGSRRRTLWDSGALLAIILLLLAGEWWLSRR